MALLILALGAAWTLAASSGSLSLDPRSYPEPFQAAWAARPGVLALHMGFAIAAMMLAPLQLLPLPGHRLLGRAYALAATLGGLTGVSLALTAHGGPVAQVGFAVQGIGWVACTWRGVRCLRRRDLPGHRAWMARSLALAYGAATLRVMTHGLPAVGFDATEVYRVAAWAGWVVNLGLVEAYRSLSPRTESYWGKFSSRPPAAWFRPRQKTVQAFRGSRAEAKPSL